MAGIVPFTLYLWTFYSLFIRRGFQSSRRFGVVAMLIVELFCLAGLVFMVGVLVALHRELRRRPPGDIVNWWRPSKIRSDLRQADMHSQSFKVIAGGRARSYRRAG